MEDSEPEKDLLKIKKYLAGTYSKFFLHRKKVNIFLMIHFTLTNDDDMIFGTDLNRNTIVSEITGKNLER